MEKNHDKPRFFKTSIGDNVVIGSNSTILPVKISSNIVVEPAEAKRFNNFGTYAGNQQSY